jgi:hypothetical protein
VAQSVSLAAVSGGSNASPAIASTPIPAPSGYTSQLTVPIANIPANTTLAITSGATLPSSVSLPPLASSRRGTAARHVRIPQATSNFNAIFYDTLVPSAGITVAGNIMATQAFPAGILSTSTKYYLGFYDSTQPNPAWSTIAGPVTTTDGLTLAFSGTAPSFSLQANELYGFAIFALAVPTATPPPAAQTLAYVPSQHTGVISEVNAAGVVATALPILAGDLGLDDSGNIYTLAYPSAAPSVDPSASPVPSPSPIPPTINFYAAGSSTATKSYTPSSTLDEFIVTAGTGAVAAFTASYFDPTNLVTNVSQSTDVWDAGSTGGTPSRTIVNSTAGTPFGIMAHDGTLYLPQINANGTFAYDVYAPGSGTIEKTITEQIVPAGMQSQFNPNYAAIGPDGTLYVTEYSFFQDDTLAGLYIYKPDGTEVFVATTSNANGAGPQGVDVDASGNIYVVNDNGQEYIDSNGNYAQEADTLHDVEVFAPCGTGCTTSNPPAVLRHITGTFDGYPIAVAADGTVFFCSFQNFGATSSALNATYAIPAGGSTATQILPYAATGFVLYDGNRETTSKKRSTASVRSAGSQGHGGLGGMRPISAAAIRRHIELLRSNQGH